MNDDNHNQNDDPLFEETEFNTQPTDRGAPAIGKNGGNKMIGASIFALIAVIGIGALIYNDMNSARPEPLTKPEEVTFRVPNAPSKPQIIDVEEPSAQDLASPVPETSEADKLALQHQIYMQQQAMNMARAQQEQNRIDAEEREQRRQERLRSPQLILDAADAGRGNNGYAKSAALQTTQNGFVSAQSTEQSAHEEFKDKAAIAAVTVSAHQMSNLDTLIPQGKMISGVLETAINSTLPGMTRAIVAENVYSFEGGNLLIPKGSHLVGSYQSAVEKGQNRIFIIWSRLIRPDGVSININSYGTDSLGRSGLSALVDTHFMERFGSSILLSLIDAGANVAVKSFDDNNGTTIAVDSGDGFSDAAEIALENQIDIQPTLRVDQGARIKVFVGQDLDFNAVGAVEY